MWKNDTFFNELFRKQTCHKIKLYIWHLNRSRPFGLNSLYLILLDGLTTLFIHYFYALKASK